MLRSFAFGLALLAACAVQGVAGAELIANQQAGPSDISRPFLRGMFGMRLRAWPDGTPVRVFVLKDDDPVHVSFCTEVLQMYPYQLRQNWDRLIYSGTGQPPIVVDSQTELIRRVAETPGAIGYVADKPEVLPAQVRLLHVR